MSAPSILGEEEEVEDEWEEGEEEEWEEEEEEEEEECEEDAEEWTEEDTTWYETNWYTEAGQAFYQAWEQGWPDAYDGQVFPTWPPASQWPGALGP